MDNDKIQETSESGENSNAGVPPTSFGRTRLLKLTAIALVTAAAAVAGVIGYAEYMDRATAQPDAFPPLLINIPDSELSGYRLAYKIDRQGRTLADRAMTVEDQEKAEQTFNEALVIFDKEQHERGRAETLNDLGLLYAHWKAPESSRWDQALRCYTESLEIKRKIKWYWAEGNTLANMGNLFEQRRQFDKAAEHFRLAVEAYEKAKDQNAAIMARNELAGAYYDAGQFPKAKECFQKCLEEARETKNLSEQARILGVLGSTCLRQFQEAEASKYFEEALQMSRKIGNPALEKLALVSLGGLSELDGKNKAALEFYTKAAEISVSNEDPETTLCTMARTSYLYYTEDQYPKAAEWSMKAVELAKELNIPETEKNMRTDLRHIYDKWVVVDPDNVELKRIKSVLDQGAEKDAVQRSFFGAIEDDDVEKVKSLLAQGADPNGPKVGGQMPLETAASRGRLEIVKLLLESGADPQKKNRYCQPILEAAYMAALFGGHEKTTEFFLDMGVNVNAQGPDGRTAMECAVQCSPEFVKKLIEKGANVNAKSRDGITPLMAAARSFKLKTVAMLLDKGAEVNALDNNGETALMKVGYLRDHMKDEPADSAAIVGLLLERGADVNLKGGSEKK